ncbi:MAG: M16 family metallopeptidase, partial [Candidatus Rokuibacteriota bacterium]
MTGLGLPFACALLGLLLTAGRAQAQAPPPVVAHVLPNGLTVLVRENPAVGVVAASLQVRAGSRFETESSAGITNFLHRAMVRGTARRTAVELAISAEDIGGSVDANGEVEAAEVRGQALAGHWEELLALVAEVALQPALRPDEVEKERRLLLGQIKARADAPFSLSFDAVLREIYGTNPYGRSHLGSRESIERLTRDDLLAHYRAIYHPDRMVLAVSGQVARARVIKAAERLFGRMARSGPDTLVAQPVAAPSGERRVIARPAQQAQILVGYLGPALSDPLFPAVRVLAAALGGGMAGRLFVELRDSRGLAYSTAVLTPFRTGPIFIVAYLGTAPASATAAEAGVLRELERVREAPIKGDELARAKA